MRSSVKRCDDRLVAVLFEYTNGTRFFPFSLNYDIFSRSFLTLPEVLEKHDVDRGVRYFARHNIPLERAELRYSFYLTSDSVVMYKEKNGIILSFSVDKTV